MINFEGIKSLDGVNLIEYDHNFYIEKFRDISKSAQYKSQFVLRLCAYIDLGEEVNKANIPFSQ